MTLKVKVTQVAPLLLKRSSEVCNIMKIAIAHDLYHVSRDLCIQTIKIDCNMHLNGIYNNRLSPNLGPELIYVFRGVMIDCKLQTVIALTT